MSGRQLWCCLQVPGVGFFGSQSTANVQCWPWRRRCADAAALPVGALLLVYPCVAGGEAALNVGLHVAGVPPRRYATQANGVCVRYAWIESVYVWGSRQSTELHGRKLVCRVFLSMMPMVRCFLDVTNLFNLRRRETGASYPTAAVWLHKQRHEAYRTVPGFSLVWEC
jgi:hypothetical protein